MKSEAYVNFDYLKELTTGNTEGMIVMLKAYLEETPKLLEDLKNGISSKDWTAIKNAAHSMLPSFAMLGMKHEYEDTARQIQDLAAKKENIKLISELFSKLESVCEKVMLELQDELSRLDKK
jgi:HPt (histidine-containing phosphotransfer) domain-containing protein